MSEDDHEAEPWAEYKRYRLPRGWTHLLGRDVIEGALRDAGAQVASLSLGRPDLPHRAQDHQIFDVYHYGDSLPGFPTAPGTRSSLLRMRWTAVPVEIAPAIVEEVRRHWLPRGCAWAAAALSHGNAWSASERRWRLERHLESGLRAIESRPVHHAPRSRPVTARPSRCSTRGTSSRPQVSTCRSCGTCTTPGTTTATTAT